MALISDSKFAIGGTACKSVDNQFNYYSQTTLLSSRIDFKSSKELSSDDSSEDEDIVVRLKSKYHVLLPDTTTPEKAAKQQHYQNGATPAVANKSNKPAPNAVAESNNKDGNQLGQPKHTLYARDKIILEWKRINKIGSGLANLGNTCFMNSVLQCLTYCPPLVNYFSSIKDEHTLKCRLNFCMLCLMMKHVSFSFGRNNQVIKPIYICQRMKSIAKHFNFGRQEDAHEFLRYVIDHMWRSCLTIHENEFGLTAGTTSKFDHLTKSTTAINQIFGGYHRSQIFCLQCKEKSNTYDYFMDFMLDIQNVSSLEEALQKYVTPEILKNDNAYKCSKCKKSVVAKKQFTVHRAPNVATFQFKRFDCSRMFGKISKPVSYPEKLNLRPYMSEKGSPMMYKLISVLVHLGASSNSGHYYCYVRNSNNSWYLMDDSHVNQVSLAEVLNQKAYVLFYIRIPGDNHQSQGLTKLVTHSQMPSSSSNVQHKDYLKNENCQPSAENSSKHFNHNFKFTPLHMQDKMKPNGGMHSHVNTNGGAGSNSVLGNHSKGVISLPPNNSNNFNANHHQSNSSFARKPTLLVPYDKDSDDEKEETNSINQHSSNNNINNKNLPKDGSKAEAQASSEARVSLQNSHKSTQPHQHHHQQTPSQSSSNQRITSNDVCHPNESSSISILKVKAATNSWQVVESSSCSQIETENSVHRAQSNWKISKSIDSSSNQNGNKKNESNGVVSSCSSSSSSNFSSSSSSGYFSNPKSASSSSSSSSTDYQSKPNSGKMANKTADDFERQNAESNRKEKRKKRKEKRREKDRMRKSLQDGEECEPIKWVERTKETLEKESKNDFSINESAQATTANSFWKRKVNHTILDSNNENDQDSECRKRIKPQPAEEEGSPKKHDILDALLRNASRGYGDNVKSWDGGQSNLNRSILEADHRKSNSYNDDDEDAEQYNEEFDLGKEKKIKKKIDQIDLFNKNNKSNPFQRAAHYKYTNSGSGGSSSSDGNRNLRNGNFGFRNSKPPFHSKHPYEHQHQRFATTNGRFSGDTKPAPHFKEFRHFDGNHHHHHQPHKNRAKFGGGYRHSSTGNHNGGYHRPSNNHSGNSHKMKNNNNKFKFR